MLHPRISEHLGDDDDTALWELATTTFLSDAAIAAVGARKEVYTQVGCCQHWISPHQMRWTADGSFSWPFGYDKTTTGFSYRALPELTWSVVLKWTGEVWVPAKAGAKSLLLRIAIPARTARHRQAAIHSIWTPRSPSSKEKVVQLYGFRKRRGKWSLRARVEVPPRSRKGRTRMTRYT